MSAPIFVSAEIGNVDASTVAVTFDQDIALCTTAAGGGSPFPHYVTEYVEEDQTVDDDEEVLTLLALL